MNIPKHSVQNTAYNNSQILPKKQIKDKYDIVTYMRFP
jgi:hypothetical protein